MRLTSALVFWLVSLFNIIALMQSARILAVIAVPSYSHQVPFQPLWAALSQRGHQVVVLTSDPIGNPNLTNLTEIDLRSNYKIFHKINFAKLRFTDTWLTIIRNIIRDNIGQLIENILEHPEVRKLYAPDSGEHFDLLFAEMQMSPALYGLAHRFNMPIIGVSSLALFAHHYYNLGSPILSSHPSSWELEYTTGFNLSLWQRIKNFIRIWHHIYFTINSFMPQQQAIAEKYFGKNLPDLNEMEKNISIIFCNQQAITTFVRPQTTNLIQLGSLHIANKPTPLSSDLKTFLENASNGFIYVSLGTNVLITSLPMHIQRILFEVFANLPCKVVWKFEGQWPDKPDNVYVANWLPQQSILAHPNIKLFVYQGGLQSTEEAVYYAVPLVGIPMLADQCSQVHKMVSIGVAKSLQITDLSVQELNSSIMDVLTDKKYKERMLDIKTLNDDKPHNMLKNAIWWTEFVIRHKGASHLQTSIAHDPWYKRYDMDVIATLSIATFVILVCVLVIIYKLLKIIFKRFWRKTLSNVEKKTN